MSKYQGLLNLDSDEPIEIEPPKKKVKKSAKPKKETQRGCTGCPLNKEDCVKIIGLRRVTGKEIMIWCQSPGKDEVKHIWTDDNGVKRKGLELVGRSGDFLWRHLRVVGIEREEVDIQNVVRCRPTEFDYDRGWERDRRPTKEEIKHCSIYNDKAIEKNGGKAKVHIVFGQVAAAALLGKEHKKGKTIFWSERLKAKVITIAHPAYFLRPGFAKSKLREFKEGLRMAAEILKKNVVSQYAYVESLNLKGISDPEEFGQLATQIKDASRKHERCAMDLEEGKINDKPVGLCMGFSPSPDYARTVYIDKSDVKVKYRGQMLEIMEKILGDETIEKIAHHAVYDETRTFDLWKIKVRSLTYDTELASYLFNSNRKKYGLAEIAESDFPLFAGYKEIIKPYLGLKKKDDEDLDKAHVVNFDLIPHTIMTIYNGADALLSKKKEIQTRHKVKLPLLHVYMDAALEIDKMGERGPALDQTYFAEVRPMLELRIKKITHEMRLIAGDPDFNPGSHIQVKKVLYNTLKLPVQKDRSGKKILSDAPSLEILSQYHKFPKMVDEYRGLIKMHGTYLMGYKRSSDVFDGEIRTNWWLTGTGTGRLRSSGDNKGRMALQNLHGDPMLQNMLVSDINWRRVLKYFEYLERAYDNER